MASSDDFETMRLPQREPQDELPTQPLQQHIPEPPAPSADIYAEADPMFTADPIDSANAADFADSAEDIPITASVPVVPVVPVIAPVQVPLIMRSTTVSDVGTVRSNNQDSSFAGEHLVAICDGMGGHAGGDTASTIAVRSLAHIETDSAQGDIAQAAHMMENSVLAAHDAIVGKAKRERKLAGMGTTITAISLISNYWVLTHIGDSRAYLLRGGRLERLTSDHSYVQHLIDTKRISEAEARNHPQRNVVMRVLGDFDIDAHPDVAIRRAQAGDRLLLCSDGLCGVLESSTIEEALQTLHDAQDCAQKLVGMALKAGSTDNVTAVIGDAFARPQNPLEDQTPLVGGAASASMAAIADIVNRPVASAPALMYAKNSPAQRAAELAKPAPVVPTAAPAPVQPPEPPEQTVVQPSEVRAKEDEIPDLDTGEIPVVQKSDGRFTADPNDPEVVDAIHLEHAQARKADRSRRFRNRVVGGVVAAIVLAALFIGAWAAYAWSQTQYYLGSENNTVTVFQGVPTNIFGIELSHAVKKTDIKTSELPEQWQDRLQTAITFNSYDDAMDHVQLIRQQWQELQAKNEQEAQAKKDAAKKAAQNAQKDADKNADKSANNADNGNAGDNADDNAKSGAN